MVFPEARDPILTVHAWPAAGRARRPRSHPPTVVTVDEVDRWLHGVKSAAHFVEGTRIYAGLPLAIDP